MTTEFLISFEMFLELSIKYEAGTTLYRDRKNFICQPNFLLLICVQHGALNLWDVTPWYISTLVLSLLRILNRWFNPRKSAIIKINCRPKRTTRFPLLLSKGIHLPSHHPLSEKWSSQTGMNQWQLRRSSQLSILVE